ncbi:MAG: hypothetical protein NTY01_18080 [Verrucomicrobia bacterium]|nr:hypothetical protein [Verrucomicrobiota bacterium]
MKPNDPDASGCPRALSLLIAAQAGVVLLAGLNIAWSGTRAALPMGEFVRWREMLSLGIFTPLSVVLQFLMVWTLERGRRDATGPLTLFALAACWLGVSMGVHEPIIAFNRAGGPRLADSLWFWKEVFSHATFFAAYTALSLALVWSQGRNPLPRPMGGATAALFAVCGVVLAAGIYFSLLPAKDIRVDRWVMVVTLIAIMVLRRRRPLALLPLNIVIEPAYVFALLALTVR